MSEVIVSSDDDEILELALKNEIKTVRRPSAISSDRSPVIETVRHLIEHFKIDVSDDSRVCYVLLQPTTPFRKSYDIDNAVKLYFENKCNAICSVVACEDNHPARMYNISEDNVLSPILPEFSNHRRQDLPPVYHRNGAVYVFDNRSVRNGKIISDNMLPYVMPDVRSVNIDTEIDLVIADALLATERLN